MRAPFVAGFGSNAGEVRFVWSDLEADFLEGFPAGAGVRGFAFRSVEFAAGRAPEAEIGFMGAMHEENFIAPVKAVEKSGDFVGQGHPQAE